MNEDLAKMVQERRRDAQAILARPDLPKNIRKPMEDSLRVLQEILDSGLFDRLADNDSAQCGNAFHDVGDGFCPACGSIDE